MKDLMALMETQQMLNARNKREAKRRRRNTQREIEEELDIVDLMDEAGIKDLRAWSDAPETISYAGCRYVRADVCGMQDDG